MSILNTIELRSLADIILWLDTIHHFFDVHCKRPHLADRMPRLAASRSNSPPGIREVRTFDAVQDRTCTARAVLLYTFRTSGIARPVTGSEHSQAVFSRAGSMPSMRGRFPCMQTPNISWSGWTCSDMLQVYNDDQSKRT